MKSLKQLADKSSRQAAGARGASVAVSISGDGIEQMRDAAARLSGQQFDKAAERALNHTARKALTGVTRALSKQVGLTNTKLRRLGRIQLKRASVKNRTFEATIKSTGRFIPLGEFNPTQIKAGTKASPWGNRQLFDRAFIFAGSKASGKRMPNGHVFINTRGFNSKSGRNNAARPLWGPAVPKEIVEGESRATFETIGRRDLPKRLAHEIKRMTKGAVD
ncbi:Prophage minor tail protein Z (GPZ) [Loktanella atrilutea]|uniref:Prophage minor tail protein Z (GPZ) n=1 Tax=Loktanella atrilutea TaxID=366533 RepID=A0A1M4WBV8_LOKAT|nr:phage tail protein [Loktanella atrilutea]SHE78758.1 Prophage minor tail protein Z (GPZ) [Loktanella atrilutea]